MKKIPCLFMRTFDQNGKSLGVRDEVTPGCEWVLNGEGAATIKFDGTAVMVKEGQLFKRYDCKRGKKAPEEFLPCQDPDPITGHWPGWVAASRSDNCDKWIFEALDWARRFYRDTVPDGTYEAVGPRINGNPEGLAEHCLYRHGGQCVANFPRSYEEIKKRFQSFYYEGVVFHHPDGRMAKIRVRDFGFERALS